LQDFQRIEKLFVDSPRFEKLLFLPVFHIALDPAQIPTLEDLESLEPDTMTSMGCASLSLQAIFELFDGAPIKQPEEIGPTLWSNVWLWMYFVHEHRDYLPATVILPEFFMYSRFLRFFGRTYVALPSDNPRSMLQFHCRILDARIPSCYGKSVEFSLN
jgi:hypothetical protein